MAVIVLAEAGLSECARTGGDCLSGFGMLLAKGAGVGLLVMIWLASAASTTVSVFCAKIGIARTILWILALWILPLFGVAAWLIQSRGQSAVPGMETAEQSGDQVMDRPSSCGASAPAGG